jgi:hypothetical protein
MTDAPPPSPLDPAAGLDFSKPSAKKRGRKLPPAVTAVAILAALAIGGYVVYSAVYRVRGYDLTQYEPNDGPAANLRARLFTATEGNIAGANVVKRPDGGGDVRLPAARVRFRKEGGTFVVESGFYNMRFVAPADYDAYLARAAALTDEKTALTPEQRTKLRAIPFTPECVRSDADKKALIALWGKYAAAPAAEEAKVGTELKQAAARIAVASMPQAAADFAESAKQVRAILTPEQIQTLRTRNR